MMQRVIETLKKYFIPHEGNNHKPHILRKQSIAFVLLIVFFAESAFLFSSLYITPRSKLFGIIQANALVDETNQQRETNGLGDLQTNALLQAAAQEKANDMVANNYFAHTSPAGVTPWDWFEKVGYQFSYAGENLAVNFSDSQDVTNAWMNSPEHRANILNGDFTQIGMATAQGTLNGQPAIYVVELFGTPADAPVAFINTASAATVTNPTPVTTPTPAPVKTTPKPVITTKPKPKPTSPIVTTIPTPVVVASASVEDSSSQQLFVAVKGAATDTVAASTTSVAPTTVTSSAPASASQIPAVTAATTQAPSLLKSEVLQLAADPRAFANDFYAFLMLLFIVALILNIFIKIRIQFPRLILGGMMVVVLSGLCVLLNQNIGLMHAAIF